MVIKWSNFARSNLRYFIDNAHVGTETTATNYIKFLVQYSTILTEQNLLGKVLLTFNSIEIRQLLCQKHRILYSIQNDESSYFTISSLRMV